MTLKTLLHPYFMILLNTYILTNKQGQSNKMEAAQYLCPRLTNLKQKLTNGEHLGYTIQVWRPTSLYDGSKWRLFNISEAN